MKNLLTVVLILISVTLFAQEKEITKPAYVIIVNNEIISEAQLGKLMQEGSVKSMNKGVSQEVRDELAKKLGDKIGEKEFIIMVELLTEKEKQQKQVVAVDTNANKEPEDELKLHIDDIAKDFTVEMMDGTSIKLSELKGKVVLVNFWATWCAPCLMEFHEIPEKIIEPFKDKDFIFIPIARGENKEKVSAKMLELNKKGISFNAGVDPNKAIWNEYAKQGIPKNFLIDKNGVIRYISTGYYEGSLDKLAEEISRLLEK